MSTLLEFYANTGRDLQGRTLNEICSWDDQKLETVHDYIQWMFPLDEASAHHARAPILTDEDILVFQTDAQLRLNIIKSFKRILKFYGFVIENEGEVIQIVFANNFKSRFSVWGHIHNHNHLRITRILKCLCLINLSEYAIAFLDKLEYVYTNNPSAFSVETLSYWREAIETCSYDE